MTGVVRYARPPDSANGPSPAGSVGRRCGARLAIGLLVCAALTAGCGSSKTPKEQFIADGDDVCRALAPRFERLAPGVTPTPGALLGNTSEYRELTRAIAARLASSRPPAHPRAGRIVVLSGRLASAARAQKAIAKRISDSDGRRGHGAFWPAAQRMREIANALDRRLRSYGFTSCRSASDLGLNF